MDYERLTFCSDSHERISHLNFVKRITRKNKPQSFLIFLPQENFEKIHIKLSAPDLGRFYSCS